MSGDDARPDGCSKRPRRTVRDAIVLMFVGAALIGGLVHYGVLRDSDPEAGSGPSPMRSSAVVSTSPHSATTAAPSEAVSPPEPSVQSTIASPGDAAAGTTTTTAVTPHRQVTCWDGTSVDRIAACSLPAGQAGLHWVFPSLDTPDDVSCQPAPASAGNYDVVVGLECFTHVDGQPVRITYERLASLGQAETVIDKVYADGDRYDFPGARGGRCTWFNPDTHPAQVTGYYRGFPYAVSVTSPSGPITKKAWATLVTMRNAADIRGRKA